jgi:hypothetical protein
MIQKLKRVITKVKEARSGNYVEIVFSQSQAIALAL